MLHKEHVLRRRICEHKRLVEVAVFGSWRRYLEHAQQRVRRADTCLTRLARLFERLAFGRWRRYLEFAQQRAFVSAVVRRSAALRCAAVFEKWWHVLACEEHACSLADAAYTRTCSLRFRRVAASWLQTYRAMHMQRKRFISAVCLTRSHASRAHTHIARGLAYRAWKRAWLSDVAARNRAISLNARRCRQGLGARLSRWFERVYSRKVAALCKSRQQLALCVSKMAGMLTYADECV
jgi:hypothetical protein